MEEGGGRGSPPRGSVPCQGEIPESEICSFTVAYHVHSILRLELWRRGEDLGPHPEDPPHLSEKFQSLKPAYLLLPIVFTTHRLELWRRGDDLGPRLEDPPHLREKFQSLKFAYIGTDA